MRKAALEISPEAFRELGHRLVDRIAEHLSRMPDGPVRPDEPVAALRKALDAGRSLPDRGAEPAALLTGAADLLFAHSLFNGHPRFFGYITSSAAPIGMLGDFLASAVNSNCGSWALAPMATEIEAQTVRWIAEFIGYPRSCGGLLVSGGNMANFVCVLAARTAKAGWDVRRAGLSTATPRLLAYASVETHTWIQKAADLFGFGTDSLRWIPADGQQCMNTRELRRRIEEDRARGDQPFLVVGTAGSVSTGSVDPLLEIGSICREFDLWFPGRSARALHCGLGGRGSPQVAVRTARGRLRSCAEARRSAQRVFLPSALLPFR
jgi:aromatic-L-amino-acid decarboxylase